MKTPTMTQFSIGVAVLAGVGALAAGCAPKHHAALEQARTNVQLVQRDPQISEHAPVEQREALEALREAEERWEDDHDREEVGHLAYVASGRAEIARAVTAKRIAADEQERLSDERTDVRLEARTREVEALRAQLAELQTEQTERGLVVTLEENVLFDFDDATLKPGAAARLAPLAAALRDHPERDVLVEGHTDSVGSDGYNRELSQRRAEAVRHFLIENGVSPRRVAAFGLGETLPVATNETPDGRQHNRRVEVVILDEGADLRTSGAARAPYTAHTRGLP